ncbi:MAG: Gfo/Idh/MocA family oxidoreductase [Alphaproteobacteria bacterium]
MSERNIRLGLIGAGRWGRNIIRTCGELSGITLARVASSNPETRTLVPPGTLVMEDWRELLNPNDVHGVMIASPATQHFTIARETIASGIPVMVEKPLTMSLGEAVTLKRVASMGQALVLVNHVHLVHPAYRAIKELCGAVGAVRAIRSHAGNWGPFRAEVPVLWDYGPHDVAMAIDLLDGEPEYVSAVEVERRETPEGIGQSLDLRCEFPGEVDVRIRLSNLLPEKRRTFAVHFDTLVMVYDPLRPGSALTIHPATDGFADPTGPGQPIELPDEQPLANAIMTFAMAIAGNVDDPGSLNLGVDVVATLSRCQAKLDGKDAS